MEREEKKTYDEKTEQLHEDGINIKMWRGRERQTDEVGERGGGERKQSKDKGLE